MDSYKLIRLMREAGLHPRSYSGRFMYGKRCVGVVTSNEASMVADLMLRTARTGDIEFVHDLMQRATKDNMAFDWIIYWPDLEWPSDVEEEDEWE